MRKNAIYRNLKNAICKGKSWKNDQKNYPENSTKKTRPYGRYDRREKMTTKSTICKGFSKKKLILRKNRKTYDFQELLRQKIPQKFDDKRTAKRPTTKIKSPEIIDLQGLFQKKKNFKKKSEKARF